MPSQGQNSTRSLALSWFRFRRRSSFSRPRWNPSIAQLEKPRRDQFEKAESSCTRSERDEKAHSVNDSELVSWERRVAGDLARAAVLRTFFARAVHCARLFRFHLAFLQTDKRRRCWVCRCTGAVAWAANLPRFADISTPEFLRHSAQSLGGRPKKYIKKSLFSPAIYDPLFFPS
jgi:hypothetical protein